MSTTGTTATALADTLPSSIPKLDASGLNWAIFSLRFQDAVEAKGYWGHFDGTTPRPVPTAPTVTPSPLPVVADGTTLGPQPDPAPTLMILQLWLSGIEMNDQQNLYLLRRSPTQL